MHYNHLQTLSVQDYETIDAGIAVLVRELLVSVPIQKHYDRYRYWAPDIVKDIPVPVGIIRIRLYKIS
jgi:hypothetical protein